MSALLNNLRARFRRLVRGVVSSHHSAKAIAGGVALGIFIGFTPLMGLQMIIAGILATMFRLSRLACVPMVYITNPLTALPIYLSSYLVGYWILKPFGFNVLSYKRIANLLYRSEELGFWDSIWTTFTGVCSLGWDGLAPLWLGCTICGGVSAVIMYHLTLRFVTGHRLIKVQRATKRARKRLNRIEREQELAHREEADDAVSEPPEQP